MFGGAEPLVEIVWADKMAESTIANIGEAMLGSLTLEALNDARAMAAAHALMDAMPIMICMFNQDLRYIYCNKHYVSMASSGNPNWKGAFIQDYLPPAAFEIIREKLPRALAGEPIAFFLDLVVPGQASRVMLVNYRQLIKEGDQVICMMTGQDATDLKAAQQRLHAAQKLETLGHLTGGIAHDFNNHVAVILGNISLLKLSTSDEKAIQRLEACQEAAGRCSTLTSQLLSFASRQPLKPRSRFVFEHLKPLKHLLNVSADANIELSMIDRTPFAAISVDTVQFGSAIMNLVINARAAMPNGGKITIETSIARYKDVAGMASEHVTAPLHPNAELVCIEVRDEGIGMSPDLAKRAFEPFVTTKNEGAGMGLAMVYGFVRQSGGFVELESKEGQGTSVRLYLPRVAGGSDDETATVRDGATPHTKHVILVVEDDIDVAEVTCEMLQLMGHSTHVCDNAADALELLAAKPEIDVVLSDIKLRGQVTGLTLRLQILQRFPHVRVICMSGYQDENARRSYAGHPEIELVAKPFDFHALAERLARRPDRSVIGS